MLRITAVPIGARGAAEQLPPAPELIVDGAGEPIATIRALAGEQTFGWGSNRVRVSADPLGDQRDRRRRPRVPGVADRRRRPRSTSRSASGPLFGLGQGGRQFDRRGGLFALINGQGEGVHSIDMNAPGARAPELRLRPRGRGRAHHHSVDHQRRRLGELSSIGRTGRST